MPNLRLPDLASHSAYLDALEDTGQSLRERYRGRPLELAEHFGLKLPRKPVETMIMLGVITPEQARERFGDFLPGLRELVEEVCLQEVDSAAAVAGRGGGKSFGVAFIEFYLWIIELFDALNMGGSELQANNVYEYLLSFLDADPYWKTVLKGDPKVSETWTQENAWIRVLTASQKSVRSPHAGGTKRDGRVAGGLLVIDEEAEADPDIVSAALPTINTAEPSINVRCSTFQNAEGSFAELMENAEEMGYKKYSWDVFDVCSGCNCTAERCESPEPCFREDHYEDYIDPDTNQLVKKLIHKAYCGGRAKYARGWIPMTEIVKLWKRTKRNHAKFEVEAMGWRPTSAGYVIKSQAKLKDSINPAPAASLYLPGSPVYINVDWGAVAAGIAVWQDQPGDEHVLLHADLVEEAGQTQIFGMIISYWNQYPEAVEVAADIGGGGNYLNPKLRMEERIPCRDVNFAEVKEAAAAAWNVLNEADSCVYPEEHEDFLSQAKKWKRRNGRINKGEDHLMDASLCYFSRFIERLGTSHIRVPPRSFHANAAPPQAATNAPRSRRGAARVPVAVAIGSRALKPRR